MKISELILIVLNLSLQLNYDKHRAGMLSTTFEIGGVLGSAQLGMIINRYVWYVLWTRASKEILRDFILQVRPLCTFYTTNFM